MFWDAREKEDTGWMGFVGHSTHSLSTSKQGHLLHQWVPVCYTNWKTAPGVGDGCGLD